MWTPPLSIPFRIFLPQTACASIWCFINKSPAYPSLTDIEITSAFLMMQVQLCLALEILLLYMISLDSQHVLHTFPSNSSMFFLPVSSSRSFFFAVAPCSPPLSEAQCSPDFFLSLPHSGCLIWDDFTNSAKMLLQKNLERHHQNPTDCSLGSTILSCYLPWRKKKINCVF